MISRVLSALVVLVLGGALLGSAPPPHFAAQPAPLSEADSEPAPAEPEPEECCKVCHKGKACGNSCISRKFTCHKPPGCACDG